MSGRRRKKEPPVPTGHDDRNEERRDKAEKPGKAEAPDGVSGDWS